MGELWDIYDINKKKTGRTAERDVKDEEITFPNGEATEFKWVSIQEFLEMYKNKEIVPTVDFGKEGYELALALF